MARAAIHACDVHVGDSVSYGDAVVSSGDACTGDSDVVGITEVDAVGVGAAFRSCGVDVVYGYVVAVVDVKVELFAVDGMDVSNVHFVDFVKLQ